MKTNPNIMVILKMATDMGMARWRNQMVVPTKAIGRTMLNKGMEKFHARMEGSTRVSSSWERNMVKELE